MRGRKVTTVRGPEDSFESGQPRLLELGEDPAADVVDVDEHGVRSRLDFGGEQAVAVIEGGEIADEGVGDARVVIPLGHRDAPGGRHDPVDPGGPAVGDDLRRRGRTQALDMAGRPQRADDDDVVPPRDAGRSGRRAGR